MDYEQNIAASFDGRKMTPEVQQELRRRCVIYFRDGVKRAEIALRLGLSRQWVTLVIKDLRANYSYVISLGSLGRMT